jgi:glycosyltransferase involved in cell wall biosynthesis
LFVAVAKALGEALTFGKPIIVMLDYPHSFLGIKHFITYVSSLLLLHAFRLVGAVFVTVDNMDPPIEHSIELKGKVSLSEKLLWLLLNKLAFRFNLIVFHSQSYRVYHKLRYKFSYKKTIVCPPGSFPEVIPYLEPMLKSNVKVFLSGRIHEWIGLKELIAIMKSLKDEGINAKFIVLDKSISTNLRREDIEVVSTYVNYFDFLKLLTEAHLLLLVRPRSLHHMLTVRATLADYAMAGRPIVYFYSLGCKEIVGNVEGCYSFKSIEEIPNILRKLTRDSSSLNKLCISIRAYAEKYLDYKKLALNLLREITIRIHSKN